MKIRQDLAEVHALAWTHIAGPGSWFSGAQRVELAKTVLIAISDTEPLPPWSSFSESGRLTNQPLAPAAAHDVAYRAGRHAGTMTETVYSSAVSKIGELPYVEVCGIVSTVAAVAHFCRNIGVDVPAFPSPKPGEPTANQPENVETTWRNWVPVRSPADNSAAVVQAYTSVPGEDQNAWRMASAQYMPEDEMLQADWRRRPKGLSRPQMELVAARVAQLRECFY